MWIFTRFGFVSAVKHIDKENTLMVRAREPGVLEMLAERHGIKPDVHKTAAADYLYRMDFKQDQFAQIIGDEILDIQYPNFKNAFKAAKPENDTRAHWALMDVWSVMHKLQSDLKIPSGRGRGNCGRPREISLCRVGRGG